MLAFLPKIEIGEINVKMQVKSLKMICLRNIKITPAILEKIPEDLHDDVRRVIPNRESQLALFGRCYKVWHGDTLEVSNWWGDKKHGLAQIYTNGQWTLTEYYDDGDLMFTSKPVEFRTGTGVHQVSFCKCGEEIERKTILNCRILEYHREEDHDKYCYLEDN